MLAIGDLAPDFNLPRDGGGEIALADFRGKKVVLFFYPKDDTPGCTMESIQFSALKDSFKAENVVILGISKDSVAKHDKFRDKHDLSVPLLSDTDGSTCEAYGVWQEKKNYGRTYWGIVRSTFLIDEDGRIAQIWANVKANGHAAKVLEQID